ncbi:U3 small nucleolar RNA-associated protein 18 like protein [Eufriesea mexicana]|uniref:U3 small nucleolar RNA-associated protein 18 like protein n=1 Tax=Eufriesea mexicana TaxID=516756 RepID=A0A310SPR2_9HYME|nr:U3 small nucleolar RNA-associated protein 18 like protein [Eufriesea mexicana]
MNKTLKKKRIPSKILYNRKYTTPLKRKRKNEYDPKEEARLERIVFGDPSDIINNLSTNQDFVESDIDKNDCDTSVNNDLCVQADIYEEHCKRAAWIDEDDAHYSIQDAAKAQNRKLANDVPEKLYKDFLCNKYKQLLGNPKWAKLEKIDKESDNLDNEILKHSCHLEKPTIKNLPKNIIDIKALLPINKQTHTEGPIVSSVEFHPSSTVALVAGTSGVLSLFQVDGIENNKLHTMHYKKFPISTAKFLRNGTEILKCDVSPDGKILALCGRSGEIFLLTASSKELISTLKMNARCRALAFTPDSNTLITHGDSNEMYIWDVNSRLCIHRAIDDGCLSCTSIAMSPSSQFLATGSKEGVVNIYEAKTVLQNQNPVPIKIILNFVTSITSLKFNAYSEILAMASDKKHNAFKMMHLPSFTVFSNFPTFQTNMSMPKVIDFSPSSGYLAISNKSGSAFLYRLKHYGNY